MIARKLEIRSMKYVRHLLAFILVLGLHYSFCQVKTLTGKKISKLEIDKFLQHQMDSLHIKGLSIAIINDGKVVYTKQ